MTRWQIETIRQVATFDFKQLCDLAILGAITRDLWFAEYFQPSAELNHRAWKDFAEAKHKWISEATKEERDKLLEVGRRFRGDAPTAPSS